MSEDYDKLKAIGTQKIHEVTHISRSHIQAVLHKTYDDMTKIQFSGFISILEREYSLDLSELREGGLAYFDEIALQANESHDLFTPSKQKSRNALYYIFITIVIFVAVVYFSIDSSSKASVKSQDVDESLIVSAQETIQVAQEEKVIEEKKEVIEEKIDIPEVKVEVVKEKTEPVKSVKVVEIKSFIIKPKANLWLSYKDLDTGKNHQTTTRKELKLDPKKTWLLTFGHGYLNIKIDGKTTKYSDKNTIRFVYKDGVMNKIDYQKFQELNAGGKW